MRLRGSSIDYDGEYSPKPNMVSGYSPKPLLLNILAARPVAIKIRVEHFKVRDVINNTNGTFTLSKQQRKEPTTLNISHYIS